MSEEDKSLTNEDDKFDMAIRRETGSLTLPEIAPEHLPTLKDVYGRGKLAELKSFGGKSLADNMERVDNAIANTRELGSVYNRNHSAWTRAYINLDSYDPWFNMRQVAAEVSSRRNALTEAKWRHLENETKIKKLMTLIEMFDEHFAKLDSGEDGLVDYDPQEPIFLDYDDEGNKIVINPNRKLAELDKYRLETELAKLQEGLLSGMNHIEGAMKEILILDDLYAQLQQQINNFNEEDYEKHNARAHLRQAIAQSLRDVRGGGSITKGEQRFLEQIGVNPSQLQNRLRDFVKHEASQRCNITVKDIHAFICDTADKILESGAVELKAEIFGLKPHQDGSFMFQDRIGTRHQLDDQSDEVKGFPFENSDS